MRIQGRVSQDVLTVQNHELHRRLGWTASTGRGLLSGGAGQGGRGRAGDPGVLVRPEAQVQGQGGGGGCVLDTFPAEVQRTLLNVFVWFLQQSGDISESESPLQARVQAALITGARWRGCGVQGVVLRTCLCLTANTGKGDTELLLDRNVFLENHLSSLATVLLLAPVLGVQPPPGAARLPPDPPAAEDGVLAHVVDLPYLGAGRGVAALCSLRHGA